MKFGVVVFPGSNCDEDMVWALRQGLGQEVVKLWHKDHDLQGADVIVVPGGFSYGDYLRSGAIARFSPIMDEVIAHANRGGYVIGICNGFQVLTEAGLVPGALLRNQSMRFVCKNQYITPVHNQSAFTAGLEVGRSYKIPIAHGEGRYFASADELKAMEDNGQILFRYCDGQGACGDLHNPNGSTQHIAGVSNKGGNVFGMMPHPERAADAKLGNTDGLPLLRALLVHNQLVEA